MITLSEMYRFIESSVVQHGYLGLGGRSAVTSRNLVPVRRSGIQISGVIPHSALMGHHGYVDNLIMYKDYHLDNVFPEKFQVE